MQPEQSKSTGGGGVEEDFLLGDTVLSVGSICRVLIYTHYAD